MSKPLASSCIWAIGRLRRMLWIRMSLAEASQPPATGPAVARRDCRFLPKQERSDWVLRQLTESWARSARSAHSLSAKLEYKTYEKEQIKAVEP